MRTVRRSSGRSARTCRISRWGTIAGSAPCSGKTCASGRSNVAPELHEDHDAPIPWLGKVGAVEPLDRRVLRVEPKIPGGALHGREQGGGEAGRGGGVSRGAGGGA